MCQTHQTGKSAGTERHIIPYENIPALVNNLKEQGNKLALCTGCYDIVHIGHIEMFQLAKANSDILVVGLDSDSSIGLTKGSTRPINPIQDRLLLVAELISVDYIFAIEQEFKFGSTKSDQVWVELAQHVKPDLIVTSSSHDRFAHKKKQVAQKFGLEFLDGKSRLPSLSSTRLINEYKS